MFDFEKAVANWRRQMMAVGIKSGATLDELEGHLRDATQEELRKGSTAEQAFVTAVARLGPASELRAEYSKVNAAKFAFLPRILRVSCFVTSPILFLSAGWGLWDCELSTPEKALAWLLLCAVSTSVAGLPFWYRALPNPENSVVGFVLKAMSLCFAAWPVIALLDALRVIHLPGGFTLAMICWDLYVVMVFTGLAYACRSLEISEPFGSLTNGTTDGFNASARSALEAAREEATRLGHDFIGTEHLLLGIVSNQGTLQVNVFGNARVDAQAVRRAVEEIVGTWKVREVKRGLPYTPRAKEALCFAVNEARAMNHPCICLEHVLLGLLLEDEGVAGIVLRRLGFDSKKLRADILRGLDGDEGGGAKPAVAG